MIINIFSNTGLYLRKKGGERLDLRTSKRLSESLKKAKLRGRTFFKVLILWEVAWQKLLKTLFYETRKLRVTMKD